MLRKGNLKNRTRVEAVPRRTMLQCPDRARLWLTLQVYAQTVLEIPNDPSLKRRHPEDILFIKHVSGRGLLNLTELVRIQWEHSI